ncbi:MAG: glycosyltransferase [Chitinophagaceae bacterium]
MKLLWLPAWYPNKTGPFDGDFIQRHARAVSVFHTVEVIHVVRDRHGKVTRDVSEEQYHNGKLKETVIYYYTPVLLLPFADKIVSNYRYRQLYKKAMRTYVEKEGIPAFAHVHVADKNGFAALWLKATYAVPFFVSEHWTLYLAEAVPNFASSSWLFKAIWRRVMNAASGFTVVSKYLGEAIQKIRPGTNFSVIPNVVDSAVFFPALEKNAGKTVHFIHISTLGYQKNPEMLLEAFAVLKNENLPFVAVIFGPYKKELETLCDKFGLTRHVTFYREIPQVKLAEFIRQSDALVLYSRYETFGCVLIEANASGVPAIVSDIPVFHEIIEEGINGYFVEGGNAAVLAKGLREFVKSRNSILAGSIAQTAREKYGYEKVGKQFSEFYQSSIKG